MIKKDLIIMIDGPKSSGRSTQCRLLSMFLTHNKIQNEIFEIDENPEPVSFKDSLEKIKKTSESEIIPIVDGGLTYPIVKSIESGYKSNDLPDGLKECLRFFTEFSIFNKVENVLLIPSEPFSYDNSELDTIYSQSIINGFNNFNNLLITTSVVYTSIIIYPQDSMLEIQDRIIKKIKS